MLQSLNIENNSEELNIDSQAFYDEYFNLLAQNYNDVVKTISQLSAKYDFLPSEKEMTIEKQAFEDYLNDPYKGLFNNYQ